MEQGTTFHIYLPASDQKLVHALPQEKPAIPGKGRILVMDDEEMVREVLGKMLIKLGYEVRFAQDGAQAIDIYRQTREHGDAFDAVILDLTVPGGMGGKEATTQLLEIDPQVKVIVSSGYSDDPIMAEPQKYKVSAVIAKPYRVSDLSERLHKVILASP